MDKDYRFAAIKLIENRRERRVSEKFSSVTGEYSDSVELKHVQRIFDFAQTPIGVGKRNSSEHSETARIVPHQASTEVIAFACPDTRSISVVKPNAGG